MSNERKPVRGWSVVRDWSFWLWLIVALIVYFSLRASGLSAVGSFMVAFAVEIAGQILPGVLRRAVSRRRNRA